MYITVLDGPNAGQTVSVDSTITIGRDPECGLTLDHDERVSRYHAEISPAPNGTVLIRDLGSTNGIHLGDERITGSRPLHSGSNVRIGRTLIGVRISDPNGGRGTATVVGSGPGTVIEPAPLRPLPVPGRVDPVPSADVAPVAEQPAATTGHRRRLVLVGAGAALAALIATVVAVASLGGGDGFDAKALTTRSKAGVYQVQTEIEGQRQATGTGWVYDEKAGYIVTNFHVVGTGTEFTVGTGGTRRTAALVGAAPCDDLAVLRVDRTSDLDQLPLGDQTQIDNGDDVVALGYPGTASDTPALLTSTGVVSAPKTSFDAAALDLPRYPNVVITQTPINPGNSGGPLLNSKGQVVGVNSAGSGALQNQNYAIGVDRVKEVVPSLTVGDSFGWTGLLLTFPSTREEITAMGFDADLLFGKAIFAMDAVPQSPAANTGIFRIVPDGAAVPIIGIDGIAMDGTLQGYCKVVGGKRRGQNSKFDLFDGKDVITMELGYA